MLSVQRRVARWELHGDPERDDETADPRDPIGEMLVADDAVRGGTPEPLWQRALRLRSAEQWAQQFFARAPEGATEQLSLLGRAVMLPPEPAEPAPAAPEAPRAPAAKRPAALLPTSARHRGPIFRSGAASRS
jgi:hypothetical protein